MKHFLHLVVLPIGSIKEISLESIEILKKADYIYCEDRLVFSRYKNEFSLNAITVKYTKDNEKSLSQKIIQNIYENKTVCIVSDAGYPIVNDPGFTAVSLAIQEKIQIKIWGATSPLLCAILLSGLSFKSFSFLGFLEKKDKRKREQLSSSMKKHNLIVYYDSPFRTIDNFKWIKENFNDCCLEVTLSRELGKKHEETLRGTLSSLIKTFSEKKIKGEIVVVLKWNKCFFN